MAQESTKGTASFARRQAQEVVQRQREAHQTQVRIAALESVVAPRFKRLKTTIVMSFVWMIVIAALGGVVAWYWSDIVGLVANLISPQPAKL